MTAAKKREPRLALGPPRLQRPQLSPRDCDYLALVHEGLQNKQIAFRLGLAEGTIKQMSISVYRKLGISEAHTVARVLAALWWERRISSGHRITVE